MPDGDARKKRNNSVKGQSQQVNDKLIKAVASGRMSYEDARKKQDSMDAVKRRTVKVGTVSSGSSQNTETKRDYKKAQFRRDNKGNLQAY